MDIFRAIAEAAGLFSTVFAASVILIKPVREFLLGSKDLKEGQKCLLRADMLRTYYRHVEEKKIRQYEFENFSFEYKAYKALKGNSFIDKIYKEIVSTWEIIR